MVKMVSITLSVSEEIREMMKRHPEINWSGLVRNVLIEKAKQMQMKEVFLGQLKKEDNLNEWAIEIGKKGKIERIKQLKKKGLMR